MATKKVAVDRMTGRELCGRRVSMVIEPRVYEAARKRAVEQGVSVATVIRAALRRYMADEGVHSS